MYRQTPYESFNQRLAELRASMNRKTWLRGQIADATRRRDELTRRLDDAHVKLRNETRDVERLEGDSILAWFYQLIGRLDVKLEEERAEVAAAVLIVEQAEAERRALDQDMDGMEARLAALDGIDETYGRLHAEAMTWIRSSGDPEVWKLFEQVEVAAEFRELYREVKEAIQAAAGIHQKMGAIRQRIVEVSGDVERASAMSLSDPVLDPEVARRLRELLSVAGDAGNALGVFRKELEDVRLHPKAANLGIIDRSVSLDFGAIFFTKLVGEWLDKGHPVSPVRALHHVDTIHDLVKRSTDQLHRLHEQLTTSLAEVPLESSLATGAPGLDDE